MSIIDTLPTERPSSVAERGAQRRDEGLTGLDLLEAEAIHIIREVVALSLIHI